jgi:AraC-like DNA-binding protein
MIWRSDLIPEKDQFASWRDACCRHVYAVTPERPGRGPFRGRIEPRHFGGVDVVALTCEGHRISRSREDIARAPSDTYILRYQGTGSAWFQQGNRELDTRSGDVIVFDPNIPFVTSALDDLDFRIWPVPRRTLDPLIATPGRLPVSLLSRADPMGALVSNYLSTLAHHLDEIDAIAEHAIVQNMIRLVALALGTGRALENDGREAVRCAKFQQVLHHIERHLCDPKLTPARAAVAVGISLRQLHLLFEPEGTSFARWVQRRRLEEIHNLLASPSTRERPIAELAFAWGFNDLSTFYRAFRAVYGVRPSDIRAASRGKRVS